MRQSDFALAAKRPEASSEQKKVFGCWAFGKGLLRGPLGQLALASPFKDKEELDLEYKTDRFAAFCGRMIGLDINHLLRSLWKAMVYISRYSSNNIDITSQWEVPRIYLVLSLLADIIIAENGGDS